MAGTKAAGRAAAAAVARAKTPLIAGGALIAGVAGGVAAKNRASGLRLRRRRLAGLPLPMQGAKLDLDTVASTARRVSAFGQQVADVAAALQASDEHNHK